MDEPRPHKVQLQSAATTRVGNWQLIRFTIKPGHGLKIDMDKRCRKCGDTPWPGALAWINMVQPYIYCDPCFKKVEVWER